MIGDRGVWAFAVMLRMEIERHPCNGVIEVRVDKGEDAARMWVWDSLEVEWARQYVEVEGVPVDVLAVG